MKYENVLNTCS